MLVLCCSVQGAVGCAAAPTEVEPRESCAAAPTEVEPRESCAAAPTEVEPRESCAAAPTEVEPRESCAAAPTEVEPAAADAPTPPPTAPAPCALPPGFSAGVPARFPATSPPPIGHRLSGSPDTDVFGRFLRSTVVFCGPDEQPFFQRYRYYLTGPLSGRWLRPPLAEPL
ncbi:hypothetical protein [Sorangium sp. So ce854]|uniref:hypothetical protein n=1 Tax=Sorangium sp. So ce854 TaxID=3133322 RepID=UPI003F648AB2